MRQRHNAIHSIEALERRTLLSFGDLDIAFGGAGTGRLQTNFAGWFGTITAMVVHPDGRIVAAGPSGPGNPVVDIVVLRYHPDGTIDTSFDGDGIGIYSFGTGVDSATALALQSDGKIVVAGGTDNINGQTPNGGGDIAVLRLNPNGTLDTSFSGDGKATIDLGFTDRADGLAVAPDGRIVLCMGNPFDFSDDMHVARLTAGGVLDTSFDGDGRFTVSFPGDAGVGGVAVYPNGAIILAGGTEVGETYDIALAKVRATGGLDTTFSGD